jgi:hypothetical protein
MLTRPAQHLPRQVAYHGETAVKGAVRWLIGAGQGCDAVARGEARDGAFSARMRAFADAHRGVGEAALHIIRTWGNT